MNFQSLQKGSKYSLTVLALSAALLVLSACEGKTGPAGTSCTVTTVDTVKTIQCSDGTTVTISDGKKAADTGTVTGTITGDIGGPADGVTIKTTPDVGQTATSDAQGAFTLTLPLGTYVLNFSSSNYTAKDLPAFSVTGGSTITIAVTLTTINPITLKAPVATMPAGFGAPAQLDVTVTGGTAPYTYSWTAKTTNPTVVTLSDPTVKNPTFTTGSLANVLTALVAQGNVVGISGLARKGFVPISAQQLVQMSYAFDVTVKDAEGFTKTVTVTIPPATLAQGNKIVPRNQIIILNVPNNTDVLTLTKPDGSTAVLNEATTPNPWFIPDVIGKYTVANLTVTAGDFTSTSATCGVCHNDIIKPLVDAKFKDWTNSAHANHFFDYMEYDTSSGELVWKTVSGTPIPAPTGDPNIFWTSPGAMPLFEFGMTGGEGSHYSSSCIACHTTGYNALAVNGGFDDVAAADGWVFPNLKTTFGGDAITKAPVFTAWNAIPSDLKKYVGMQCESCHGPFGNHSPDGQLNGLFEKPVAEYDVGTCAVCHDKPANHDKVALWRQSDHASLDRALSEGTVEGHGTSTSCYRCHAAQGFVQYLKNKDTDPSQIVRPDGLDPAATCTPHPVAPATIDPNCPCTPTAPDTTCMGDPAFYAYLSSLGLNNDQVQPQTCAACHDAHSTEIRVSGNTGPLGNGAQMNNAGKGALCMVCHNTRNGARGDFVTGLKSISAPHAPVQTDLFLGVNAYFMGAGGKLSKHAAVKETCVGCHMNLAPDSITVANTNHTFIADGTICKKCHSADVGLDGINGQFMVSRGNLEKALATAFTAAVTGTTLSYYVLVPNPDGSGSMEVVHLTAGPTSIVPSGRSVDLQMTFASAVPDGYGNNVTTLTVNYQSVSLDGVLNSDKISFKNPIISKTGLIAKANWNYWLVSSVTEDPAANVIHNPSFVFDVLSATTTNLLSFKGQQGI